MHGDGVDLPPVSAATLRWFTRYARWYMARSFHAVRVARRDAAEAAGGRPAIVVLNHPSWWDPLFALLLAAELMPRRRHYAPIEAAALARYRFFERIGFFGIEPGTARGARRFLEFGERVLRHEDTALWVTAQGHFADPRVRPVALRGGVGHLVRRLGSVAVLPVAVEYPFWEERFPEALARVGEPLLVEDARLRTADEWTEAIEARLEATQNLLARDAMARNAEAFTPLLRGSAGVGGVYDVWRWLKARLHGERFHRAHGTQGTR